MDSQQSTTAIARRCCCRTSCRRLPMTCLMGSPGTQAPLKFKHFATRVLLNRKGTCRHGASRPTVTVQQAPTAVKRLRSSVLQAQSPPPPRPQCRVTAGSNDTGAWERTYTLSTIDLGQISGLNVEQECQKT
eukprot:3847930-Amphidinium_carterae.1